jgi:hypothetical protein
MSEQMLDFRKLSRRFPAGVLNYSQGVHKQMVLSTNEVVAKLPWVCLMRHLVGDWGDVLQEDKDYNEKVLSEKTADRLISFYDIPHWVYKSGLFLSPRIVIVTEGDRKNTYVMYIKEFEEGSSRTQSGIWTESPMA